MFRNLGTPIVLIIIVGCMAVSALVTYVVAVPSASQTVQQVKCPPEATQRFPRGNLGTIIGDEQRY
jgi:hypothetical protein